MALSDDDAAAINIALENWRQGDVTLDAGLEFLHLADLSRPHSSASQQAADSLVETEEGATAGTTPLLDEVPGLVMLSQTCDVVRDCRERPFAEVAPLVQVPAAELESIRRLKRPAFAYVPAMAAHRLVVDLDRVMTVEKAIVAGWARIPGWADDAEQREFALAASRKRLRFAFPDDFVVAASALQARLIDKHNRQSDEGEHLRMLREIRVRAAPSWNREQVQLSWWFIKDGDPVDVEAVSWPDLTDKWLKLFDQTGRFHLDPPTVCRLEDMTARDYIESDRLDLDRLSTGRKAAAS